MTDTQGEVSETDPRNPAFLINNERSWRMPKGYKFHRHWWKWVFWRRVWARRYRAAVAQEKPR